MQEKIILRQRNHGLHPSVEKAPPPCSRTFPGRGALGVLLPSRSGRGPIDCCLQNLQPLTDLLFFFLAVHKPHAKLIYHDKQPTNECCTATFQSEENHLRDVSRSGIHDSNSLARKKRRAFHVVDAAATPRLKSTDLEVSERGKAGHGVFSGGGKGRGGIHSEHVRGLGGNMLRRRHRVHRKHHAVCKARNSEALRAASPPRANVQAAASAVQLDASQEGSSAPYLVEGRKGPVADAVQHPLGQVALPTIE
jgi:hypothetical protein